MLKTPARPKMFVFSTVLAVALTTTAATSVYAASTTAPNLVNHNLAVIWGSQFRALQADRTLYDNFKIHREEINSSSPSPEDQQYLDQYAFALKQAEAIVVHGGPSSTSIVKVNSRFEKSRTAQQDLATFLHMMRGLREKLLGGS